MRLQAALLLVALATTDSSATFSCGDGGGWCQCTYATSGSRAACPDLAAVAHLPPLTRELDMTRRGVASLADGAFAHLPALQQLRLSRNGLESASPAALLNLTDLRELDLSHNLLAVLPSGLLDHAPRLQRLDLSFNRLAALPPDTFRGVPSLDELSLSYNDRLGAFLLQASPGPLSVAFANDLRALRLDHVGLGRIPDGFFVEAEALRELSLADNPLEEVPFLPGGLEKLDMSGCGVRRLLPGSFVALPFLRALSLERSRALAEVERNALEGLSSLREVSLAGCRALRSFHGLAFGDHGPQRSGPVRRLSLARGGLATLAPELEPVLGAAESVDLQGNPWSCDCRIAWLRRLNLSAGETGDLRCAAPPELRNARLWSLHEADFRCVDTGGGGHGARRSVAAALGTALLLLAAAVGGAVLWRRLLRGRLLPCGGDGARRAPGAYEMLRVDAADDVVWRTDTSAR